MGLCTATELPCWRELPVNKGPWYPSVAEVCKYLESLHPDATTMLASRVVCVASSIS